MGFFKKRSMLPPDIVERVIGYIRTETRSRQAPRDFDLVERVYSLHPMASADPASFTRELALTLLPVGGEAARGGARLVWELVGVRGDDPNYLAMLDAGIGWLRETGAGAGDMFGYESDRWFSTRPEHRG